MLIFISPIIGYAVVSMNISTTLSPANFLTTQQCGINQM